MKWLRKLPVSTVEYLCQYRKDRLGHCSNTDLTVDVNTRKKGTNTNRISVEAIDYSPSGS